MNPMRILTLLVVCIAFGGAVAMALDTHESSNSAYRTVSVPEAPQGQYTLIERPELRPALTGDYEYTSPEIPGTVAHTTRDGISQRTWHVYAPTSPLPGARPVVILLHGHNRDSMSMIDQWQEVARRDGVILIGLNQPTGGWQNEPLDGVFLHKVLDEASAQYNIDRSRMFLYGHSAGAIAAQHIANRVIGPWRGVAVHAGTANPSAMHRIENAPPVRHYLGSSDAIFDPGTAMRSDEVIAQAGHDHTLILIPFHNHWFYEGGPAFAADAWAWFERL